MQEHQQQEPNGILFPEQPQQLPPSSGSPVAYNNAAPTNMLHPIDNELLLQQLSRQVDFYFSPQNLARDDFLRSYLLHNNGSVPIDLVASFPMMKKIMASHYWQPWHVPVHTSLVRKAVLQYSATVMVNDEAGQLVHPGYQAPPQPYHHALPYTDRSESSELAEHYNNNVNNKTVPGVVGDTEAPTVPTVSPTSFTNSVASSEPPPPSRNNDASFTVQLDGVPRKQNMQKLATWLANGGSLDPNRYTLSLAPQYLRKSESSWHLTYGSEKEAQQAMAVLNKRKYFPRAPLLKCRRVVPTLDPPQVVSVNPMVQQPGADIANNTMASPLLPPPVTNNMPPMESPPLTYAPNTTILPSTMEYPAGYYHQAMYYPAAPAATGYVALPVTAYMPVRANHHLYVPPPTTPPPQRLVMMNPMPPPGVVPVEQTEHENTGGGDDTLSKQTHQSSSAQASSTASSPGTPNRRTLRSQEYHDKKQNNNDSHTTSDDAPTEATTLFPPTEQQLPDVGVATPPKKNRKKKGKKDADSSFPPLEKNENIGATKSNKKKNKTHNKNNKTTNNYATALQKKQPPNNNVQNTTEDELAKW